MDRQPGSEQVARAVSGTAAQPVIEVRELTKRYGQHRALDGVSMSVDRGEIVAVLGPNGAGKTTLLEILEGHRSRDAGQVQVLGRDPARPTKSWRAAIGIVLQEQGIQPELTVGEVISLYAGYYPAPRPVDEVLELVGLADRAGDRVESLSGGAKRRLDVGLGIVGRPSLLFLDEPTTGFDPDARRKMWQMVHRLRDAGTTVLLTTHYLDEATELADRLLVIRDGQVAAQGTPAELCELGGPATIRFTVPDSTEPPLTEQAVITDPDGTCVIRPAELTPALLDLADWVRRTGIDLEDLTVARPTLEDVYLELIT